VQCGVNGVTLVPDGIEMTTIDSVRTVVSHSLQPFNPSLPYTVV